jgi:hypothetical protein
VNTTNCGINGNCSSPSQPGCIVVATAPKPPSASVKSEDTVVETKTSADPLIESELHPGKQGYKGDRQKKKVKLDKPKDKNLKVDQVDEDHVRFAYPTATGTEKTIEAQIFKCKVSHKLHPEKDEGTFSIGYEIEPIENGSPIEIPDADVAVSGLFAVTVMHEGVPVDIILHEHSSPTNYVSP